MPKFKLSLYVLLFPKTKYNPCFFTLDYTLCLSFTVMARHHKYLECSLCSFAINDDLCPHACFQWFLAGGFGIVAACRRKTWAVNACVGLFIGAIITGRKGTASASQFFWQSDTWSATKSQLVIEFSLIVRSIQNCCVLIFVCNGMPSQPSVHAYGALSMNFQKCLLTRYSCDWRTYPGKYTMLRNVFIIVVWVRATSLANFYVSGL